VAARVDGGGLPLREAARVTGIVARIEPTVDELVAQRIVALALGYEVLNDHDDTMIFDTTRCTATKRDGSFTATP